MYNTELYVGNSFPKLQVGHVQKGGPALVVGQARPSGVTVSHIKFQDISISGTALQISFVNGKLLCQTFASGLNAAMLTPRLPGLNRLSIAQPSNSTHTIQKLENPTGVELQIGSIIVIFTEVAESKKNTKTMIAMAIVMCPMIPVGMGMETLYRMHRLLTQTHNHLIRLWASVHGLYGMCKPDYNKIKAEVKTLPDSDSDAAYYNVPLIPLAAAQPVAAAAQPVAAAAQPAGKRAADDGIEDGAAASAAKRANTATGGV